MSYDFAAVIPETAGGDDQTALAAAVAVYEDEGRPDGPADPRVQAFLEDLAGSGAVDHETGWLSVWPLEATPRGLAVPTTYADVDGNLVALLRLAARHGLVLVDLSSETVHRPSPGLAVGVRAGDGTRLGALTHERLASILDDLPAADPWVVLEHDTQMYAQARRRQDGTFEVEHREGSPDAHFATTMTQEKALELLWAWVTHAPAWKALATWEQISF